MLVRVDDAFSFHRVLDRGATGMRGPMRGLTLIYYWAADRKRGGV